MPSKEPEKSKWIEAIERVQPFDYVVQRYFLCQLHFLPDDIGILGTRKIVLPGKIPSIFAVSGNNENTSDCSEQNEACALVINDESRNSSSSSDNVFNTESPVQNFDESSVIYNGYEIKCLLIFSNKKYNEFEIL